MMLAKQIAGAIVARLARWAGVAFFWLGDLCSDVMAAALKWGRP